MGFLTRDSGEEGENVFVYGVWQFINFKCGTHEYDGHATSAANITGLAKSAINRQTMFRVY